MKLDARNFAMAVAHVWAAAALLCAVMYKMSPEWYARGANLLLHSNMFTATRAFGWGEVAVAVVAWWILAAVLAGAAALLYNADRPVANSR